MIEVSVPFANSLMLIYDDDGPLIALKDDIHAWLERQQHTPTWVMNNPWEALFYYDNAAQATLFKLTWG